MKLYNQNGSHFAAKCRIAIYEKNAPVEITPIPGGDLKSAEYLRIYPLGKTPALAVDGQIIGESEIINEFLEDRYPTPRLLPADALGRARARTFSRLVDLYLEPSFHVLFPQVMGAQKDQALIATQFVEIATRLDYLESLLSSGSYALGGTFTLADCSLAPLMLYAQLTLQMLGGAAFISDRPKLAVWWAAVQQRPSVQKVHAEMMEWVMEMQAQAAR